jgi:transposase InsO family protein
VERILTLRRQLRWGPRRLAPLVGLHHSTIYAVLRQCGFSRLTDVDRSSGVPIRYVRDHPGELLHLDMKPLGRIPPGGGHRVLGRETAPNRHRGLGYEIIHVAVDDASRFAFAQILADGLAETAARFLLAATAFFADQGIHVERIMTDRAFSYARAHAFRDTVRELQLRHKIIRPYRPQTNGKAERFIQTMLREWAYARVYRSNEERQEAFAKWLHYYNHHRPHTALGGHPPAAVSVNNVCRQHT